MLIVRAMIVVPNRNDRRAWRRIVARMARHVPGLPAERIATIMDAVITESLTAWEDDRR